MVTFLPRRQSLSERFGRAFGAAGESLSQEIPKHMMEQEEKRNLAEQSLKEDEAGKRFGIDLSGIKDPKLRQMAMEYALRGEENTKQFAHEKDVLALKGEGEREESTDDSLEKIAPFKSALETVNRMRQIGSGGNLGRGSAVKGFFGGATARDRSEYAQLGKSLISFASSIPIRNQREFETLAHDLYDPSLPDSAREGILNAMERIISQAMQQQGLQQMPSQEPQRTQQGSNERPPLSSFHR